MKFVFVVMAFLTVLAALVGCQKMADLPDCATTCSIIGLSYKACNDGDVSCLCKKNFVQNLANCLKADCSKADQKLAINFAQSLCAQAGVPIPSGVISSLIAKATVSKDSPSATESGWAFYASGTAAPDYSGAENPLVPGIVFNLTVIVIIIIIIL